MIAAVPRDEPEPAADVGLGDTRLDAGLGADPGEAAGPQQIGRFAVLRKLGAGGMGVVYSAYDEELDRRVAIKLLQRDSSDATERMRREAQAMAKVSHPNVAHVYEVGTWEGQLYLAIEFIKGRTLGAWVEAQTPSLDEIVAMLLQAGRGLHAAHEAGLVHRDFKPDNVMVGEDGRARVLDFGLAVADASEITLATEPMEPRIDELSGPNPFESNLTRTGAVLGTPAYMSPEQFQAKPTGPASDQFSFCVTACEVLYGERPFGGDSLVAIKFAVQSGAVREAPEGSQVPPRVRAALLRGLSVDPEERYPSLDALLDALQPPAARQRSPLWLLPIATLPLAAWLLTPETLPPEAPRLCDGVGEAFDASWGAASAAELRTKFAATDLGFASGSAERVIERIDQWGTQWKAARQDACGDTRIRGEQSESLMDARMRCLDGRLRSLNSLTRTLLEPDDEVVQHAVSAVSQLPTVDRCGDAEYVNARVPPPDDPSVAEDVEGIRVRLAEIDALALAGKYKMAWDTIAAVDKDAAPIDYAPLKAEVALRTGTLGLRVRKYDEAETALRAAFFGARTVDDGETATRAAVKMVRTLGLFRGDHDGGLEWGEHATVEVERLRDDGLRAELYNHLAVIHHDKKEFEVAVDLHRKALALRREHYGKLHPDVAKSLLELGMSQFHKGEWEAAKATVEESLAVTSATQGDDHPDVAKIFQNAGAIAANTGRAEDAVQYFERAAQAWSRARGPDSTHRASAFTNAAMAAHEMDAHERESELFLEAIAVLERSTDEGAPEDAAFTSLNRAIAMVYDDKNVEGVAAIEKAVARLDELKSSLLPNGLQNLGMGLRKLKRHDEAVVVLRRAVALYVEQGEDGPELGGAYMKLAKNLHTQGIVAEAREAARKGIATLPPPPADGARDRFGSMRKRWTAWLAEH